MGSSGEGEDQRGGGGLGEVLEYGSQMGKVTLLGNGCHLTICERNSRVSKAQPLTSDLGNEVLDVLGWEEY